MPKVRKLSPAEAQRLTAKQPHPETVQPSDIAPPDGTPLEAAYPHLADWIHGGGWIELGQDEYSRSYLRILNIGGMLWEGGTHYTSLDALLGDAEHALVDLEESGDVS